jgi:hypothetical protein
MEEGGKEGYGAPKIQRAGQPNGDIFRWAYQGKRIIRKNYRN